MKLLNTINPPSCSPSVPTSELFGSPQPASSEQSAVFSPPTTEVCSPCSVPNSKSECSPLKTYFYVAHKEVLLNMEFIGKLQEEHNMFFSWINFQRNSVLDFRLQEFLWCRLDLVAELSVSFRPNYRTMKYFQNLFTFLRNI